MKTNVKTSELHPVLLPSAFLSHFDSNQSIPHYISSHSIASYVYLFLLYCFCFLLLWPHCHTCLIVVSVCTYVIPIILLYPCVPIYLSIPIILLYLCVSIYLCLIMVYFCHRSYTCEISWSVSLCEEHATLSFYSTIS